MDPSPASPGSSPPQANARRRRVPPLRLWVAVAALLGGMAYIRIQYVTGDHQLVNILTLILVFAAMMLLVTWFVFASAYSRGLRWSLAGSGLAAVAVLLLLFEVYQVSGELVPRFRYRFAPPPDHLLPVPGVQSLAGGVDLATTTDHDFPQFLGPDRSAYVETVQLVEDWQSQPPRELWRQPIGAGWSGFVAVNGYAITLEQRGPQELVTCYEVETGKLRWSYGIQARHATILGGVGPRSTPTVDGGRVYVLGATGHLACLAGDSGQPLWTENLLQRYGLDEDSDSRNVAWGRAGSPLIVDELVVVPAGGPTGSAYALAAFDKHDGTLRWQAGDHQISYASPVLATLAGVRQILSVNESSVTGHDPQNGKVLWSHDWPGRSDANANTSNPAVVDDSHVLLSKGYGGGAMLLEITGSDQFQARKVWHQPSILKTKLTNVVLRHDYAYGLSDGILECVEALTGRRMWKRGRYGHGQVLGVGEHLLVQAEDGRIVLLRATPEKHVELGSIDALEGKTWNTLCLYGPYLLARNAEQACCYVLPIE